MYFSGTRFPWWEQETRESEALTASCNHQAICIWRGFPRHRETATLGLGLVVFAGAALVPPEYVYLALLFLGAVLLLRRKPWAMMEHGVKDERTPSEAATPQSA